MIVAVALLFIPLLNLSLVEFVEGHHEELCSHVIACVSPKLLETLEECETHGEENNESIKELEKVADCLLKKSGTMDPAKKIDLAAVKKFTISDSKLTSKQKQAAVTKFDSCMAAKYPSPYKLLHYKPNDFPAALKDFVPVMQNMFQFGKTAPTDSIVAIDCAATAMIQNGCSTATKEEVNQLIKDIQK